MRRSRNLRGKLALATLLAVALMAPSYQNDAQVDADVSTHTGTAGAHHAKGATAAEANSIADHESRVTALEGEVSGTLFTSGSAPVDGTDACDVGDLWSDTGTPSLCHCTNGTTDTWACVTTTN